MNKRQKQVLISGGGIAGPVLGFLLHRVGWHVTIVERAPKLRATGQQIDISGTGLTVVRRMGLDKPIREQIVRVDGMRFVDSKNRIWAEFAQGGSGESFVKEYEILRSDLAGVFYEATKEDLEWIMGDYITAINQREKSAVVSFKTAPEREFDLVVAADGFSSKTRGLVFREDEVEIRSLNQYGCLFTIPWTPEDGTWDRWYSDTNRRCLLLRPQADRRQTGGYFVQCDRSLKDLPDLSPSEQKKRVREVFTSAAWSETPRMLQALDDAEDFYAAEAGQIHCKSIVKGRVTLLGDAAFCPSPVSGQGTTIALTGAYILAGCLAENDNVDEALHQFEKDVKPFVDKAQTLIPGTPQIANPKTKTGILCFYTVLWIVSLVVKSGLTSVLTAMSVTLKALLTREEMQLPRYPALERVMPEPDADAVTPSDRI